MPGRGQLSGTDGEQPQDAVRDELPGQRPERGEGACVSPLHVIERDQHRRPQRRALQGLLQFAHQPEPLVR